MIKGYFAPFIHSFKNAPYMYITVMIALIPCIVLSVVYYGIRAGVLILASQMLFFLFDILFSRLIRAKTFNKDAWDISAFVSGTIFALMLPPDTSLWVVIVGILFGSMVVKQFFGGVGSNIINPAIGARLFVQLIMPDKLMGFKMPFLDWYEAKSLWSLTPSKGTMTDLSSLYFTEILFGKFGTFIGIGCGIMVLFGAVYLLLKRIVRGYAFFGYLGAVVIFYPILNIDKIMAGTIFMDLLVYILTSGVLFIALFALGDFTTMPVNPLMRMFSAAICALLTMLLFKRVDAITALCTPVLLINLATPPLDFFTDTLTSKAAGRKKAGDAE